jgi:ketosteroid isomerase-like protein
MEDEYMITHIRTAALLGLSVLVGAAVFAQGKSPVRAAIEANNKKFAEASKKGDAATIAQIYATDAEAFPPNAELVKGRAALQQFWKGMLDSGVAAAETTTRDVEVSGNLATESGTYVITAKDGKVADKGKYNVVWKRIGGEWKIYRDIWNSSMPAPAAR